MSVEFHEEEIAYARRQEVRKPSIFTRIVMKLGLAKDEAGTQRVLLIIAGVCFAAALLVFVRLLWFI